MDEIVPQTPQPDQNPNRLWWPAVALPGCSPELVQGLDEATRSRVHVYSAFFHKRLHNTLSSSKQRDRDLSPLLGWTEGVDLFKKAGHPNMAT